MNHFLKQKQMNGKKIYRTHRREDRISLLPDPLLRKILLNLPTKDVVKTSLLSTRWRSVWLSVPGLDLDDKEFPDYTSFVNFVDRFVKFSVESPIQKLKLTSRREVNNPLAIRSWVDKVIGRNIQHLEINYFRRYIVFEFLPISLFVCHTLVCLRIRYLAFSELNLVSLPRLKTMHLEEVWFTNRGALQTLIASCPVLEDLTIIRCEDGAKVLRLCSQTINSINLVLDVTNSWDISKWAVVIDDTPRLNYLSLKSNRPASFTINSLCSPSKVDIGIDFNVKNILNRNDLAKRISIGNFLTCTSTVRDMTICWKTLKVFHQYSKLEPLPQFCNMSQLYAKISPADLNMLPDLLEKCPNLKSLVLELSGYIKKKEQISFSSVPWCLSSSLESVEMKTPIGGTVVEMELIRYFLENSRVLKKLTLSLGCLKMKEKSIIFKELLTFRRCSNACQVKLLDSKKR